LLQSLDLKWILLPHSVALTDPEMVMVPARQKIADYVDYRVSRLNELLDCFKSTDATNSQTKTQQQLFDLLYGPKNLADPVKPAAFANLQQQTEMLCQEGMLAFDQTSQSFSRVGLNKFQL